MYNTTRWLYINKSVHVDNKVLVMIYLANRTELTSQHDPALLPKVSPLQSPQKPSCADKTDIVFIRQESGKG
jgi:hypothetical protein